jgi:hypothetical protein
MLTLTPTPDPIEQKAEQIADLVFSTNWDRKERDALKRYLLDFAALVQREVRS